MSHDQICMYHMITHVYISHDQTLMYYMIKCELYNKKIKNFSSNKFFVSLCTLNVSMVTLPITLAHEQCSSYFSILSFSGVHLS